MEEMSEEQVRKALKLIVRDFAKVKSVLTREVYQFYKDVSETLGDFGIYPEEGDGVEGVEYL